MLMMMMRYRDRDKMESRNSKNVDLEKNGKDQLDS